MPGLQQVFCTWVEFSTAEITLPYKTVNVQPVGMLGGFQAVREKNERVIKRREAEDYHQNST